MEKGQDATDFIQQIKGINDRIKSVDIKFLDQQCAIEGLTYLFKNSGDTELWGVSELHQNIIDKIADSRDELQRITETLDKCVEDPYLSEFFTNWPALKEDQKAAIKQLAQAYTFGNAGGAA